MVEHLDIQLDREDVILLLVEAYGRLLGRPFLSGITRLEKLVYLLDKETGFEGIARFFPFEPHNFGPFSKEVYEAVNFLEGCGLLEVSEKSYASYYESSDADRLSYEISDEASGQEPEIREQLFALTRNGETVTAKLRVAIAERRPRDLEELDGLVLRYGSWPLRQLIRYVYRRYPEMTSKSVHPEAERLKRQGT